MQCKFSANMCIFRDNVIAVLTTIGHVNDDTKVVNIKPLVFQEGKERFSDTAAIEIRFWTTFGVNWLNGFRESWFNGGTTDVRAMTPQAALL